MGVGERGGACACTCAMGASVAHGRRAMTPFWSHAFSYGLKSNANAEGFGCTLFTLCAHDAHMRTCAHAERVWAGAGGGAPVALGALGVFGHPRRAVQLAALLARHAAVVLQHEAEVPEQRLHDGLRHRQLVAEVVLRRLPKPRQARRDRRFE